MVTRLQKIFVFGNFILEISLVFVSKIYLSAASGRQFFKVGFDENVPCKVLICWILEA